MMEKGGKRRAHGRRASWKSNKWFALLLFRSLVLDREGLTPRGGATRGTLKLTSRQFNSVEKGPRKALGFLDSVHQKGTCVTPSTDSIRCLSFFLSFAALEFPNLKPEQVLTKTPNPYQPQT